jgi:hypothetical protein
MDECTRSRAADYDDNPFVLKLLSNGQPRDCHRPNTAKNQTFSSREVIGTPEIGLRKRQIAVKLRMSPAVVVGEHTSWKCRFQGSDS